MPRLEPTTDPYDPARAIVAWAWAAITNFDNDRKVARVVWEYYASHAAAYRPGALPIARREQVFGPEAVEAVYGQRPELTPYQAPVYGEPDPETGETTVVAPEVLPTYGDAPPISPRVPSYDEALAPVLAGTIGVADRVDQLGVERWGGEAIPAGPPAQAPSEG